MSLRHRSQTLTPSHRIIAELEGTQVHRALVLTRLARSAGCFVTVAVAAGGCALGQAGHVHLGLWSLGLCVPVGLVTGTIAARLLASGAPNQAQAYYKTALTLLGDYAPGLQSAVQSALDLHIKQSGPLAGFSPDLIAQHLESTAQRLFAVNLLSRWHKAHGRALAWAFRGIFAGFVLSLVMCAACSEGRARLWQSLREPKAWHMSETALIDDLSLRYNYPAYTHAPTRIVQGSDGTIAAIEGTEVDIEVQTKKVIYRAWMEISQSEGEPPARIDAMDVADRKATYRVPVLHDGNYRLILDFGGGDGLGDPTLRTLHVVADAAPTVIMSVPFGDITLRDNQPVDVQWRCEDDFNLQEAKLVIERPGHTPSPIELWTRPKDSLVQVQADGQYTWNTATLGLAPGETVSFYVAAWDTDTNHGPKRGISVSRKLTLYSARAHHEELVAKCRAALDSLIDVLGLELENPVAGHVETPEAWRAVHVSLQEAATRTESLDDVLTALLAELKDDPMAQPQIRIAFANVAEHVHTTRVSRTQQVALLEETSFEMRGQRLTPSAHAQRVHTGHLESDIIYLDDLLAVARIDEIKDLAKDLLADQRHLKELLHEMGNTQDPKLKSQMQEGINALRQKMLDVLRKMSEIKQNMPGEYRNMEASSMLRLDDQLSRLDKQLRDGDLTSAAEELEQLANMVENMVQSLGEAQKQYGGERYDAMRNQLQGFADEFRALEDEQESLSQRSELLLDQYRQKTLAKTAKNKDDFVKKARLLTHEALSALDEVGHDRQLASRYDFEVEQARQGLLDLDSLLTHQDFSEANSRAAGAEDDIAALAARLGAQTMMGSAQPNLGQARKSCNRAATKTEAVATMLAQLFDDPDAVLSPAQKQQMDAMDQKQRALEAQTDKLSEKMQQMAGQMPLFGDENQQRLGQAGRQMQSAAKGFGEHALVQGATASRQAAQTLGQLRQSLQQAAQQSGQGVPLPMGTGPGGLGERSGAFDAEHQEEVAIPGAPNKPAGPTFRQDLMEAAKQKAPAYYEDAVRRYYKELIR